MADTEIARMPATPKTGDPNQVAKDLFSGACGGIAQVLIGQPFDIIKVRLQTSPTPTTALSTATSLYTTEGPLAFYKGTLTPLLGIGACVSIQFSGFHAARRFFERRNTQHPSPTSAPLTLPQYYLAGAFAGLSNSFLSGPIEHIRIRLQTQPHNPRLYSGPLDCIRTLLRHGGIPGLFRGQAVNTLREIQAYGAWFLTFEALMGSDVKRRGLKGRGEVEAWRLAVYGGMAGEALWLTSYPFDVVKSRMQADGLGVPRYAAASSGVAAGGAAAAAAGNVGAEVSSAAAPASTASKAATAKQVLSQQQYPRMRDAFAATWREGGVGGFFRGIGPTLVRAMPVSAATFVVAEMTLRLIS